MTGASGEGARELDWIATAPQGAASVLAEELLALGAREVRERTLDVRFRGPLELGYRACLWARSASRVLLELDAVPASSAVVLLEGLRAIEWQAHLAPGATLACAATGANAAIRHTLYGSQLLKDAVCDRLRADTGARPDIRPQRPDVLLHLHLERERAVVSVDFSGESLHRRGYRLATGAAPLKENVAAAVLWRAGWPALAAAGAPLVDPLCGSGTLLIEAALIAGDVAPGLGREYFGFLGWRGHDRGLWERLLREAQTRRAARSAERRIFGSDHDAAAVAAARANAAAAGVAGWMDVRRCALAAVSAPAGPAGLLVCNPPYGERIGAERGLERLYGELGTLMRERFVGWKAAVLTGAPDLGGAIRVRAQRTHRLKNGSLDCLLLRFDLAAATAPGPGATPAASATTPEDGSTAMPEVASAGAPRRDWAGRPGAQMFANRLRKNLERLGRWAAREQVDCYRLYDADMPEYAFAIDLYGREQPHVHLQEYAAPAQLDPKSVAERRREVLAVVPQVLEVPLERMHSRVRRPGSNRGQYARLAGAGERHCIAEGGLKFWINFRDYLDTGIFLDNRLLRARLREWAAGGDFLNLFCYTATASVYAAAGGARSTLGIDLSNTYLDWARDNLELNGFGPPQHRLERADCLAWLAAQPAAPRFDLIYIDPPTFSNSKRMEGVLDVQRDHVRLIEGAARLLRAQGSIVFSTHYTRFRLDAVALEGYGIEELSATTLPKDFERNPRLHHCFRLRPAGAPAAGRGLRADRATGNTASPAPAMGAAAPAPRESSGAGSGRTGRSVPRSRRSPRP